MQELQTVKNDQFLAHPVVEVFDTCIITYNVLEGWKKWTDQCASHWNGEGLRSLILVESIYRYI